VEGGDAGDALKDLGKVAGIFKSYGAGDIDQPQISVAQKRFCLGDADIIEIDIEGGACFFAKNAAEIIGREVAEMRELLDGDFFAVVALNVLDAAVDGI